MSGHNTDFAAVGLEKSESFPTKFETKIYSKEIWKSGENPQKFLGQKPRNFLNFTTIYL